MSDSSTAEDVRIYSDRELDVRVRLANKVERDPRPSLSDQAALCTAVRELAKQVRHLKRIQKRPK